MADLYEYASIKSIPFKLTLSNGAVTGLVYGTTLPNEDITVSIDSATFVNANTLGTIAEIGKGWYKFTPTNATIMVSSDHIIINIANVAGGVFDENGSVQYTHGDPLARFHG